MSKTSREETSGDKLFFLQNISKHETTLLSDLISVKIPVNVKLLFHWDGAMFANNCGKLETSLNSIAEFRKGLYWDCYL